MSLCPTCGSPVRHIQGDGDGEEFRPLVDELLAAGWQSLISVHETGCGCDSPGDPSKCVGVPLEAFKVLAE